MSLAELSRELNSTDPERRLAAAWDIFDVAWRAADAAAEAEGSDEIAAFGAAIACTAGREMLPLPTHGSPCPLPDTAAETQCAELLEQVAATLSADALAVSDPDLFVAMLKASDHARDAAACLRRTREA